MSKPVITFYIFHGNDGLRLEEEVGKMRAQMGDSPNADMNIAEFDGEIVSESVTERGSERVTAAGG